MEVGRINNYKIRLRKLNTLVVVSLQVETPLFAKNVAIKGNLLRK